MFLKQKRGISSLLTIKKLPKPFQIRTFCIELHNAINSTNSNIFRQIQGYKIENTINFS